MVELIGSTYRLSVASLNENIVIFFYVNIKFINSYFMNSSLLYETQSLLNQNLL